jgi:ADP-ribose pyrophosphatase
MAINPARIKKILSTPIFDVEEVELKDSTDQSKQMYRLSCSDWANVLAITTDQKAVLVRQPRAGALSEILETPGGMLDPEERDPTIAAQRELEEETGFTSQRILALGTFNPNPAIMTNRIHYFLALGCYLNPSRSHFPDPEEQIKIEIVEAKSLNQLVRTRRIDHALSALCIMLASKYIDIGS